MLKTGLLSLSFILSLGVISPSYAMEKQEMVTKQQKTALDYYNGILTAYQSKDWKELILNAKNLISAYGESPFAPEAYYYKGVAYYYLEDFEMANVSFSQYLRNTSAPKFFEEAIEYKFQVAEKFYEGARRHLLGFEKLPKVLPAKEQALDIYEEIITTLPRHDLTAKALYRKGCLLNDFEDYKISVEAFHTLIRRFPKHYHASDAFLGIQRVYLNQCQKEFPDPNVLELAEINLNKFKEHFPGDPRVDDARKMLVQMEDRFAEDLFEIGSFYERTKHDDSAVIYYTSLVAQYPHSSFVRKAEKRLEKLHRKKQHQIDKKTSKK